VLKIQNYLIFSVADIQNVDSVNYRLHKTM